MKKDDTGINRRKNNTNSGNVETDHDGVRAEKKQHGPACFRGNFFQKGQFDVFYFGLVMALLVFGLIMLASASSYQGYVNAGRSMSFFSKQLTIAAASVVIMILLSRIKPRFFVCCSPFRALIILVTLAVLIIVLFYHTKVDDADSIKRWIPITKSFSIQASDVGKIGLIIMLAYYLEHFRVKMEKYAFICFIFIFAVTAISFLVYKESALSATIMIFGIGIFMIILGGMDSRLICLCIILGVAVGLALWVFRHNFFRSFQLMRIIDFKYKDYLNTEGRYQTNQSIRAFAIGGLFGKGLGNSFQKYTWLPESHNDFIFAIVGEELGFVGCMAAIVLYVLLIIRGVQIAKKTNGIYEKLLVEGISIQIALQTFLNILVSTDILPNTGISLPFFSYGGTAIGLQLVEMGMVLSVSRKVRKKGKDAVR